MPFASDLPFLPEASPGQVRAGLLPWCWLSFILCLLGKHVMPLMGQSESYDGPRVISGKMGALEPDRLEFESQLCHLLASDTDKSNLHQPQGPHVKKGGSTLCSWDCDEDGRRK